MKYNYIAIEREYASGGSEIGKKVSDILNIPCYGREYLKEPLRTGEFPWNTLKSLKKILPEAFCIRSIKCRV